MIYILDDHMRSRDGIIIPFKWNSGVIQPVYDLYVDLTWLNSAVK